MISIGRLCVKTAGRDAGKTCVVVDVISDKFVLVDGQVRRKRCNIKHLEPLKKTIDIKKEASHEEIVKEFKKLKIEIKAKRPKKKVEKVKEAVKVEKPAEKIEKKKIIKKKPAKEPKATK